MNAGGAIGRSSAELRSRLMDRQGAIASVGLRLRSGSNAFGTALPTAEQGDRTPSIETRRDTRHRKERTPGARVVKWAAVPEAEGRVDLSTLPGDAVRELASSPPVVRVIGTTIRYLSLLRDAMNALKRSTGSRSESSIAPTAFWHDMRTTDFARVDADRTVALLPVAAIEQHGPHLPLSTDAVINEGIVSLMMQRLPADSSVLVLPALTIGDSLEHTAFKGTLSVDLQALLGLWLSVGHSVARAGVRKLVLFNSHGGQRAHVDQVALRLRVECSMLVVRAHSFALGVPTGLFDDDELTDGLHGGAVETSLMLHLRPDLVRQEALSDFPSAGRALAARGGVLGLEGAAGLGWMMQDVNPDGACGNAATATAAKGERLLNHLADRLVALLGEVAQHALP